MADVPEDLVARRLEQAVQGDGELAGAEVGAEVAADLADCVDDQLAGLLGELLKLGVGELGEVVAGGRGLGKCLAGLAMRFGRQLLCLIEAEEADVGDFSVPLI